MGDRKNLYDFLYIGNLVHAHLLAADALLGSQALVGGGSESEEKVDREAFQITNDETWLFWDFTRAVTKESGYPVKSNEIKVIPMWVGMLLAFFAEWTVWILSFGRRGSNLTRHGVRYSCLTRTFNINKAKKRLGYRPLFSMHEGLQRTMKWFVENELETK